MLIKENKKILLLEDGEVIKISEDKKTTSFNFKTTQFDLEKYSSKTTKTPKVQEIATINLIKCLNFLIHNSNSSSVIKNLNCSPNFLKNIYQELYKRIYLPIYIILLSLISSTILLKSKNTHGYFLFKIKIFLMGVFFIILSDILLNFTGNNIMGDMIYLLIPILSFFIIYQFLVLKLKVKK